MTWGSARASLYVKCVGTVRAASHPPVWIHRKCELRSLKKMLNGLCCDDDYTIAQRLEHRWLQARVPGASPGGDSQFFSSDFSRMSLSLKPVKIYIQSNLVRTNFKGLNKFVCLIGSSSYPDLTKKYRYADYGSYLREGAYCGKWEAFILSISQKQAMCYNS